MKVLVAAFLLLASPALAQPAPPYAAPDADLWALMVKALSELPASLSTHQQIQQIMANVQREALSRATTAKPKAGE